MGTIISYVAQKVSLLHLPKCKVREPCHHSSNTLLLAQYKKQTAHYKISVLGVLDLNICKCVSILPFIATIPFFVFFLCPKHLCFLFTLLLLYKVFYLKYKKNVYWKKKLVSGHNIVYHFLCDSSLHPSWILE